MGGRRIRWASVGRVAAIAAAAIAGILSLPALLGSDKPPPVPADVGLTSSPENATAATAAEPPDPKPAIKPDFDGSGKFFRHIRKNSPKGRSGHGQKHGHGQRAAQRSKRRRRPPQRSRRTHRPGQRSNPAVRPPSVPASVSPAYSYVPPPSPGEFRIER